MQTDLATLLASGMTLTASPARAPPQTQMPPQMQTQTMPTQTMPPRPPLPMLMVPPGNYWEQTGAVPLCR